MPLRLTTTLLALLLVGCATTASPPPGASQLANLRYSCGGDAFGLEVLTVPGTAERESHPSAEALRAFLAGGEARDLVPVGGWHLAGRDERTASYVALVEGDPPFAEVQLESTDGGWKVVGHGQCRPQLAIEGVGPATFQFAGRQPGPDDRRFDVLVTEMACASGKPMGARLQPPQIARTAGEVHVLFTVRSQDGAQDCPSNPSTQVTIDLGEPLGGRRVVDAAVFPFRDPTQPWPPG